MIINLIAGISTGFVVSIPPMGPVAFALISKGFKNKIKEGRAIAFGSGFMDFFYSLLAFSGISLILSIFPSGVAVFYAKHLRLIEIVLTFTGCAVVVFYGLKIIKKRVTYDKLETEGSAKLDTAFAKANQLRDKAANAARHLKMPEIQKSNLVGSFFMGVLLCVSSLTLPAAWLAIVGYLKGYNILNSSFLGGLLFASGVFVGTLAWYYILLRLITGNKKRINGTTINKLNVIAGAIMILLGIFLFIKAAVSVFSAS